MSREMVSIGIIILVVLLAILLLIKAMQTIGLEKVRKVVYDGFITAENIFKHGDNDEKFDYVITIAKQHIPLPFSLFITEDLLRAVVQAWFDLCKDLLDDGKLNNTSKQEGK